jgi:hypothetical protein
MTQSVPTPPTKSQKSLAARYAYHALGSAALFVLAVGTVIYHYVEGWTWVDSLYFSVVAGTTVGFGDLTPTTDAAKLFSILYIFFAIGIVGTFIDLRLKYHGAVRKRTEKAVAEANDGDQT